MRIATRHAGETIVVSCHGGVVDALLRLFLRVPSTGGFEIRATNASLTEFLLAPSGLWQMIRYNDSAHLAGLPIETDRASA